MVPVAVKRECAELSDPVAPEDEIVLFPPHRQLKDAEIYDLYSARRVTSGRQWIVASDSDCEAVAGVIEKAALLSKVWL